MIVAELREDQSDHQTDYFASRGVLTIALAWSKHDKDLFGEMRKAAASIDQTAHMGPGRGKFIARVVFASDIVSNGRAMWVGMGSPWHRDLYGADRYDAPEFTTRAEAEAFVEAAGAPHDVHDGDQVATFRWEIVEESIEHREKYSMGAGYYLGAEGRHSGWQVRKIRVGASRQWEGAAGPLLDPVDAVVIPPARLVEAGKAWLVELGPVVAVAPLTVNGTPVTADEALLLIRAQSDIAARESRADMVAALSVACPEKTVEELEADVEAGEPGRTARAFVQALEALQVITKDRRIRTVLDVLDPKALDQCRAALLAAGVNPDPDVTAEGVR